MPKKKPNQLELTLEVHGDDVEYAENAYGASEVIPIVASFVARLMLKYDDITYQDAQILFADALNECLEQGLADVVDLRGEKPDEIIRH